MEVWQPVVGFHGYVVSDRGRVMNEGTGHILTQLINQTGVAHVGLTSAKVQYKRSVALLVATAFLPHAEVGQGFNTPIHLDGDQRNNDVENLLWRPRWFAIQYQFQFNRPIRGYTVPIMETRNRQIFPTSMDAAMTYGLLDKDILLSIQNNTVVWPTYQTFKLVA